MVIYFIPIWLIILVIVGIFGAALEEIKTIIKVTMVVYYVTQILRLIFRLTDYNESKESVLGIVITNILKALTSTVTLYFCISHLLSQDEKYGGIRVLVFIALFGIAFFTEICISSSMSDEYFWPYFWGDLIFTAGTPIMILIAYCLCKPN